MNEIKIKCPTCGKVLRLLETPNIDAAYFTCPVCKEKHIVGKCQRYVEQPKPIVPSCEETQYLGASSQQPGGDETRIGISPIARIGMLVDNKGASYQLCSGVNTIGRKATTSSASIQIATDDRTMSRSHAIIEVRNAGGQTIHILRNGANKNPSYLNGSIVARQDQLILNNGDHIKMGNTELTFKK
ncbi:MAG: FHA domain-containing protein [Prevotella sp.]|uniref:FHA domain-containing protein n=1 Tax=Prevotella sp. TaxID=59823 RepID=UPI0025D83914|nr:FHA domain-containing protein [Prevotella sp.]MCI7119100.1 FHA domain-containing protein [Prevotella sp.]